MCDGGNIAIGGVWDTKMDRAVSGAGIGAGAGAITDKNRINFGDPLWR